MQNIPAALNREIVEVLCNRRNASLGHKSRGVTRNNVGEDQVSSRVLLNIVAIDSALARPLQSGALDREVTAGRIGELDSLIAGRWNANGGILSLS